MEPGEPCKRGSREGEGSLAHPGEPAPGARGQAARKGGREGGARRHLRAPGAPSPHLARALSIPTWPPRATFAHNGGGLRPASGLFPGDQGLITVRHARENVCGRGLGCEGSHPELVG